MIHKEGANRINNRLEVWAPLWAAWDDVYAVRVELLKVELLCRNSLKSLHAACKRRTKAWPSGLYSPGFDGVWKVRGSTVLRSQPSLLTLLLMTLSALLAAGMNDKSDVRVASRYVVAARSAVEDESTKEFGSSMILRRVPFHCCRKCRSCVSTERLGVRHTEGYVPGAAKWH